MLCKVVPIVDCGIRPLSTQVLHGQMSWSKSHRHRFDGIKLTFKYVCTEYCAWPRVLQCACFICSTYFLHGRQGLYSSVTCTVDIRGPCAYIVYSLLRYLRIWQSGSLCSLEWILSE